MTLPCLDLAEYAVPMEAGVTDCRGLFLSRRARVTGGTVPITSQTENGNGDGLAKSRQAFRDTMMLTGRELLAANAKSLRNMSRCREASLTEEDLRKLTTNILARGPR